VNLTKWDRDVVAIWREAGEIRCGNVELAPGDVTLIDRGDTMAYGFACPACDTIVAYPASEDAVLELLMVGVEVRRVVSDPLTAAEVEVAIDLLANVRDLGDLTDERGCW
jgi:hypothetical protein